MDYWKKIKKNNTPSTSGISAEFIIRINAQSKVLEVGCGSGRIIDICVSRGSFIYGIDINENEINFLRLKYKSHKNLVLEINDIANRNFKLETNHKFDFVFLNGLLGALKKEQRSIVLENILKLIHHNSMIHLSEFLLWEENEEMRARYIKDFPETEEYGTFFVYNNKRQRVYLTHNFKETEIENLVSKYFKIVKKELSDFMSYTGKIKPGIILLLQSK